MIRQAAFALSLSLAQPALADARIEHIAAAWSAGDPRAVQRDFANDAARAEIAWQAERGGAVAVHRSARVAPGLYAASVTASGRRETWLFTECDRPRDIFFCGWQARPVHAIGGAEAGQGFDFATTAVGVGMLGAAELNPLGAAIFPLKVGATAYTHRQQFADCLGWRLNLDRVGFGAGVANVVTLAANISAPAVSLGLFAAFTWARSDAAREAALFECAEFALDRAG